ncbi:MAG: hypothetical protein DRQ47_10525 [Gammaproteobacteria bacterium]|nr:MAG: hypothetical protein DRQ47_10525 [Gammaproteobacteria bacterium]
MTDLDWREVYQRQHHQVLGGLYRAVYHRNLMFSRLAKLKKQFKAKCQELEKMKNYQKPMTNTNQWREQEAREHSHRSKPAMKPKTDLTTGLTALDDSSYDRLLYSEDNRICFMLPEDKGQRWYYGLGSLHMNILGLVLSELDSGEMNKPIHEVINKLKQRFGEKEIMEVFRHSTRNLAEGNLNFSARNPPAKPAYVGKQGKPSGW